MATIQEHLEFQREQQWRKQNIQPCDIEASRLCGMHPADICAFREFTLRGYLIIVRCPKVTARVWHGRLPPKPLVLKKQSGSSGIVADDKKRLYVSDYDLMCVWKPAGAKMEKVFISAPDGREKGPLTPEAKATILKLNQKLISRLQHGCQDDYHSEKNRGVRRHEDHFAAFHQSEFHYLPTVEACEAFYRKHGLPWLYNASGDYNGPII